MTNSSFLVSLLGSMPRSKKLLTAKRKLNKGNIDLKTYQEILAEETKYVINLQENNNIDIITNGELSRDNYVSFIAEKLNGVTMMSMADMFDYIEDKQGFEQILEILDVPAISIKNAICTGKVKYNKPLVADEMIELKKLTDKKIKATLPGPYLITRSMWLPALSKQYYDSKDSLGEDIIKVLKEEIDSLAKIGIDVIQFDEPVLTEVVFSEGKTRSFMCAALSEKKDPTEELKFATKLIKSVIDYAKEKEILVSLHVCRGNWSRDESILLTGPYTPLLPLFEETLPNILTLEFSTPRAGEISSLFSSTLIRDNCILGLGVMNPRTDDIEPLEDILNRVEEVMQYIPKERIWLNPDCGFATFANRPVSTMEIIDKKLARLNEAKITLRKLYE
ncbi:cobalamin-independent methionine synthase II family protein [Gemella haemolysans]|uniref:Cobalamin-independent methionine synthase II family protein n=1 Tax=Gemella haemolysans TaxID=1379 RepID=A0AAW6B646_9BACL|nr:cobalamin-independent methionine synthase II family protein [Gemella haemolysans]MDB6185720.1 cobalamin-independent methionine synthase II family protein [Gemella haemolysans]MDB6213868.1 cobalamin-independent methionine synthase II family protein [Gemella haemolysans]